MGKVRTEGKATCSFGEVKCCAEELVLLKKIYQENNLLIVKLAIFIQQGFLSLFSGGTVYSLKPKPHTAHRLSISTNQTGRLRRERDPHWLVTVED